MSASKDSSLPKPASEGMPDSCSSEQETTKSVIKQSTIRVNIFFMFSPFNSVKEEQYKSSQTFHPQVVQHQDLHHHQFLIDFPHPFPMYNRQKKMQKQLLLFQFHKNGVHHQQQELDPRNSCLK